MRAELEDLAEWELLAIRTNRPDSWQRLSYVSQIRCADDISVIYCVTHDERLLARFAGRIEKAIDDGFRVCGVAQAGDFCSLRTKCDIPDLLSWRLQLAAKRVGRYAVNMLSCDSDSLEAFRPRFADLFANYPAPSSF